jgi:hypothetical protein
MEPVLWDPWHFGTDPRIRASDFQIRIRICSFLSVAVKMSTKNKFFFQSFFSFFFLKTHLHQSSQIKSQKSKNSRNQGFSYLFACWWKDPNPTNNKGSGSGRPKIIRIHNTDWNFPIVVQSKGPVLDSLNLIAEESSSESDSSIYVRAVQCICAICACTLTEIKPYANRQQVHYHRPKDYSNRRDPSTERISANSMDVSSSGRPVTAVSQQ